MSRYASEDPYARCIVACAMAEGFFDANPESNEGFICYLEAVRMVDHEIRDPLHFMLAFIQCEWILRTYIWKAGDSD